jgi:hypothetical protein
MAASGQVVSASSSIEVSADDLHARVEVHSTKLEHAHVLIDACKSSGVIYEAHDYLIQQLCNFVCFLYEQDGTTTDRGCQPALTNMLPLSCVCLLSPNSPNSYRPQL